MSDFPAKPSRQKQGFAAMRPEEQRRIASLGGVAAHRSGHAHQFTSEEGTAASARRKNRANEQGVLPGVPTQTVRLKSQGT